MTAGGNSGAWIFVLIPILFCGVGALFFYMGLRTIKASRAQKHWMTVPGVVIAANPGIGFRGFEDRKGVSLSPTGLNINTGGKRSGCFPQVTYEYIVGNLKYTSSQLGAMPTSGYSETRANQIVMMYPPGLQVMVFFDPANPQNSVLRQTTAGCVIFGVMGIGAIFAIVGALVTAAFLFAR